MAEGVPAADRLQAVSRPSRGQLEESLRGVGDGSVEAHSSHYPAPRHSYDRHPCNDPVAVGDRLIRSLAIRSGVESCSPGDRWLSAFAWDYC